MEAKHIVALFSAVHLLVLRSRRAAQAAGGRPEITAPGAGEGLGAAPGRGRRTHREVHGHNRAAAERQSTFRGEDELREEGDARAAVTSFNKV